MITKKEVFWGALLLAFLALAHQTQVHDGIWIDWSQLYHHEVIAVFFLGIAIGIYITWVVK